MKLFDRLEVLVFKTVGKIFGEIVQATWASVDGLVTYSGTVLLNSPTHKETLDGTEFVETDPYFEYLAPAFPGLKFRVDGQKNEVVIISGISYHVTNINQLSDGNTYKAFIQLVTSEYGPVSI